MRSTSHNPWQWSLCHSLQIGRMRIWSYWPFIPCFYLACKWIWIIWFYYSVNSSFCYAKFLIPFRFIYSLIRNVFLPFNVVSIWKGNILSFRYEFTSKYKNLIDITCLSFVNTYHECSLSDPHRRYIGLFRSSIGNRRNSCSMTLLEVFQI